MAANLKSNSESEFSERYNKIYRYQWRTSVFALPQIVWQKLDKLCAKDWGYHFIPHTCMDYTRPNWYEDQTLYLTFQDHDDLVNAKLSIDLKN